jgi:ABC-type oligopeptide transport system ATPase subunit
MSALDTSVAAQIVNLRLVRHLTTRAAVMRLGRIVELAPTDALFSSPRHPSVGSRWWPCTEKH